MSIKPEERQRRMSLEDDFMNYTTDDLLFGAMYYLATYDKNGSKLYLSKKKYNYNRQSFYEICGLNAQSLKRHLDKLSKRGLIKVDKVFENGSMIEAFVFPYDKAGKYRLVNNETLWYLVSTRNQQAIRVYLYLLNGYLWKEAIKEKFVFTNTNIMQALGYSTDNKLASSAISNILTSFAREGVIAYSEFYENYTNEYGKSIPVPKKRLDFVAKEQKEFLK